MKIKDFNLFKKPISLWLISLILLVVSFEGILSFPYIIQSSQTITQYIVTFSHAFYVITGIVIIIGLWVSRRFTSAIAILWGIAGLGAALGGPLAFSSIQTTFLRTAIIMTIIILTITSGLFLYTRYIIKRIK